MGAAPSLRSPADDAQPLVVTLLDLVRAISEITDDESEIVAAVRHMLHTGRIRLGGNFRDTPCQEFD
jgi:hypothetical protein